MQIPSRIRSDVERVGRDRTRVSSKSYSTFIYSPHVDGVREATYWWRIEYNEEKPHDSLADRTPAEDRQQAA
jgi:transposase InsO family protein